jgi:hypothetical protein
MLDQLPVAGDGSDDAVRELDAVAVRPGSLGSWSVLGEERLP